MRLKKHNYYWPLQLGVFMLSLVIAPNVLALSLMIGESEINGMLALAFPYEVRMGSSHISLADPKPHFYEASQEIGITLNISLKEQGNTKITKATTLVRGGIHFDEQQQLLQLVKPKVVSLDWVNKPTGDNRELIEQVTRLVGQDLPIIILFDIKQLTGDALTLKLSGIKVKKQGIEVSF